MEKILKAKIVMLIMNQLEEDFDNQEYDSIDELVLSLVNNDTNKKAILHYLSIEDERKALKLYNELNNQ